MINVSLNITTIFKKLISSFITEPFRQLAFMITFGFQFFANIGFYLLPQSFLLIQWEPLLKLLSQANLIFLKY